MPQRIIKHLLPLLFLPVPVAFAEVKNPPENVGLSFSSGLDVIGGLFLVLALFMACAWLMKRTQGGFLAASKEMKTLGAMSLGTREKAVLVEVEGQKLLLGVSPGRVTTLHVFEQGDDRAQQQARQTSNTAEPQENEPRIDNKNDFASQLMQFLPQKTIQTRQNNTASK